MLGFSSGAMPAGRMSSECSAPARYRAHAWPQQHPARGHTHTHVGSRASSQRLCVTGVRAGMVADMRRGHAGSRLHSHAQRGL
eukprot:2310497-Rhodomonas_salina.1